MRRLLVALFSRLIRMRISSVRILQTGAGRRCVKRRSDWAEIAIRVGNFLFRQADVGVQVIPAPLWPQRELELLAQAGIRAELAENGRTLSVECMPGNSLADILEQPASPLEQRLALVAAALAALREVHAYGSHGDATAENTICDPDSRVAAWIDFDTCHAADWPKPLRIADDLRAFALSVLACTQAEERPQFLSLLLQEIFARSAAKDVRRLLLRACILCEAFSLAQARGSSTVLELLLDALPPA